MALAIPIPEKLLNFLSEKVAPILKTETQKILSIPELVEDIENETYIAKVFLRKTEEKADRAGEQTKKRVRELRELVYKSEDILDEYELIGQQLKYQQGNSNNGCIMGIFEFLERGSSEVLSFKDKHRIACRIVKIKKAMEKLKGDAKNYEESMIGQMEQTKDIETDDDDDDDDDDQQIEPGKKKLKNPGYCPLYKDEEELVGFINAKYDIIENLDLEKRKYKKGQFVLAVWGQPGVGKTTLSRKVFEAEIVRSKFLYRAWITATKPYKKVDLLKSLFKQFIKSSSAATPAHNVENHSSSSAKSVENHSSSSATQVENHSKYSVQYVQNLEDDVVTITDSLRNYLKDNHKKNSKYFVVLDDVSEKEELSKIIKAALVPSQTEGGRIMVMTKSEGIANYWKTSSFHGKTHNLSVLSEQNSYKLFNKIAFGNQGYCPRKLERLSDTIVKNCDGLPFLIEKVGAYFSTTNKWIELYQNFQISPLRARNKRVLMSSYHEMPYHLKHCFLYLCMFPKGYELDRMRIVRLWIAEGFIEAKGHSTPEEAAEEYLNELVERGMLHILTRDDTERNREYKLPQMWHHIMLPKLADLSFCQVLPQNRFSTNNRCRRWSVHEDLQGGTMIPSSVRSILSFAPSKVFPISWPPPYQESSFRLKVLDLQKGSFKVIPDVLGNLHNLRYLSLRDTEVKEVPNSIGGLWNLETLDLKRTLVEKLPDQIKHLQKLRHLLVGRYEKTRKIPVNFNTEVLEILTNLQKLVYLDARSKMVFDSELESLTDLQKLLYLVTRSKVVIELESLTDHEKLAYSAAHSKVVSELKSLTDLQKLVYLDARSKVVSELESLTDLQKQAYLNVCSKVVFELKSLTDQQKLMYLDELSKVDSELESLTHLQKLVYLDERSKLVSKLEILTDQQKLTRFRRLGVEGLGKLTQLRRLGVEKLSCEATKKLCVCLQDMKLLRSLSLTMLDDKENMDLTMTDDHALQFLERLYLVGGLQGNKLPRWVINLKHLVRIKLKDSRFKEDPSGQLRMMNELLVLHLDNPFDSEDGETSDSELGTSLIFGRVIGFKKLKLLLIKNMQKLKLKIPKGKCVLPQLQNVLHENCPNLVSKDDNLLDQRGITVNEMPKDISDDI